MPTLDAFPSGDNGTSGDSNCELKAHKNLGNRKHAMENIIFLNSSFLFSIIGLNNLVLEKNPCLIPLGVGFSFVVPLFVIILVHPFKILNREFVRLSII